MKKKLVSVIIPSFNRRKLVGRAIQSVLDQTYKNVEIIVVDDGSNDGTSREVFNYVKENKNVHYYYKDNGGCASALNYGIKKCKGDLVSWLSSDDWYEPTMLQKSVITHDKYPTIGMTYTTYNAVMKDGKKEFRNSYQPKNPADAIKKIEQECFINGSSIMVKRDVFYNIGMFNDNFKYAQDYDFYYRILHNYPVRLINEPLLNYWDVQAQEEEDPAWLGKEVFARTHTNEGEPVRERYKLMYEKGRKKVTAMICIKDEEELIEQCLDDLIMYVDAIVIFNDGSTDRSLEIIKKYPKVVDIYTAKPKIDERTEGVDREKLFKMAKKTKPDWILMIDADEVMEDTFKTEIWKQIKNDKMNLYHYQSFNFWRNRHQYRVDEMWFKGFFGKLFRNIPKLKYRTEVNEHCGSVPCNIPGAPQWFNPQTSTNAAITNVRIKHYGYSDWNRVENKYISLMIRDEAGAGLHEGRHARYDRMVTETGMDREEWKQHPYYLQPGVTEDTIEKPENEPEPVVKKLGNRTGKILFVGSKNNTRSIMAQKIAESLGYEAHSAGTNPDKADPLTSKVLNEIGLNGEYGDGSSIGERPGYDCIVTMSPHFLGVVKQFRVDKRELWNIPLPKPDDEESYKEVLNLIKLKVEGLQ